MCTFFVYIMKFQLSDKERALYFFQLKVPDIIDDMVNKQDEDFVFYKPFKADLDKISSIDNAEKQVYLLAEHLG